MITVRLTDRKTFSIPFSIATSAALKHGCKEAFRHITIQHGEQHLRSQSKLNKALREIDHWLTTQLAKQGRSELEISSLKGTACSRKSNAENGIFDGKSDPDFFLIPESLTIHVFDQYTGFPIDPEGAKGIWVAAGDYASDGSKIANRFQAQIIVWKKSAPVRTSYPDNNILLGADLAAWEAIYAKCVAVDEYLRVYSDCLSEMTDTINSDSAHQENPNKAKFYLIKREE